LIVGSEKKLERVRKRRLMEERMWTPLLLLICFFYFYGVTHRQGLGSLIWREMVCGEDIWMEVVLGGKDKTVLMRWLMKGGHTIACTITLFFKALFLLISSSLSSFIPISFIRSILLFFSLFAAFQQQIVSLLTLALPLLFLLLSHLISLLFITYGDNELVWRIKWLKKMDVRPTIIYLLYPTLSAIVAYYLGRYL